MPRRRVEEDSDHMEVDRDEEEEYEKENDDAAANEGGEDDTPNPWNYVKMIPSKNPKKKDQFQCIKCFSVFSGGATRIK
jgi:hypothetical protein